MVAIEDQLNRLRRMGVRHRDQFGRFTPQCDPNDLAKSLFISLLTDRQRNDLSEKHYLIELGGITGWIYKIHFGCVGNIAVRRPKEEEQGLCCHLQQHGPFPMYDHMIAQLLYIRYNEKKFLATAYPRLTI